MRSVWIGAVFILLCANIGHAQTPSWIWAVSAGGNARDEGYSIAVDSAENSYVTGYFSSSDIAFDTTMLTYNGKYDVFIAKYSARGRIIWARGAGGTDYEEGRSIGVDRAGNSYVTGRFASSIIILGNDTLMNSGDRDIFVVKFDANGNTAWARSAGGSGVDEGWGIAVDNAGNSYVTGAFSSPTITFGGTTLMNYGGGSDIFIVKYNANGNVVWAKSAGGNSFEDGYGIAVDENGNCYVTGFFLSQSISFDSTMLTNSGSYFFVAKYDSNGNIVWAKTAGPGGEAIAVDIAVDRAGNSYITGDFTDTTITFGNITLTNNGFDDIFTVKYDANGNVAWAKSAGGRYLDRGTSIVVDETGNSYLAGYYYSPTITFDSTTLVNVGEFDSFVVKYNSEGNTVWAKNVGGNWDDEGHGIAVDGAGNGYLTGWFDSPNLSFGNSTLTKDGIFVAKFTDQILSVPYGSGQTPGVFALEQNYPNPFNPITEIRFEIPVSDFVSLKIYNVLGQEVSSLISEHKRPGSYSVKWDASAFPSGIYFYGLRAGEFASTKKLLLIR